MSVRISDDFVFFYRGILKRIDFPVDEVTVFVDEGTGKSVLIDRDN